MSDPNLKSKKALNTMVSAISVINQILRKTIPVIHDNQNGAISTKYYCLDCFKKELHG
jgi:hypothetical protein